MTADIVDARTDRAEEPGLRPVEEKLIAAAVGMLAEVGPRAMSVRAVAARAGVNHGLVHHYFGSKEALLRAAMTDLVHRHRVFAQEKSDDGTVPAPFALLQDQQYLRAVVRCVLDGEMDLAVTEITEGVSMPRNVMDEMAKRQGAAQPDAHTKALIGVGIAIEMGWAALEPFIKAVTGSDDEEMDEVRAEAIRMRRDAVSRWWNR